MKILIAGSTGFVGKALVDHFKKRGYEVIALSRHPDSQHVHWNPQKKEINLDALSGADVVINLSGESIFGYWTDKKKEAIRKSRMEATHFLCDSLLKLPTPPKLYIGASAIGFYGDRPGEKLDEKSGSGKDFLAEVCREWEEIPTQLTAKGTRVALTRFGIVLGKGGALKMMKPAFKLGLGGMLGQGKQTMSWIAIDDLCSAMSHLIDHPELSGPINFVAPEAVSNRVFTDTIGKVVQRPTLLAVPSFAIKLLLGEAGGMFLASVDVKPQKLLESGYQFQFPTLEAALKKYLL